MDLLACPVGRNINNSNTDILDCFHCLRNKARIHTFNQAHVTQNKQYGLLHTTNHYSISPLVCRGTALSIYILSINILFLIKVTPTAPFTYYSFLFRGGHFLSPTLSHNHPQTNITYCTRLSTFFYPSSTNKPRIIYWFKYPVSLYLYDNKNIFQVI